MVLYGTVPYYIYGTVRYCTVTKLIRMNVFSVNDYGEYGGLILKDCDHKDQNVGVFRRPSVASP